jgi:hypothetical protein
LYHTLDLLGIHPTKCLFPGEDTLSEAQISELEYLLVPSEVYISDFESLYDCLASVLPFSFFTPNLTAILADVVIRI